MEGASQGGVREWKGAGQRGSDGKVLSMENWEAGLR